MKSQLLSLPVVVLALALAACGKSQQQAQGPAGGQQMPPPEVGVIQAQPQEVPLTRNLVGRLSATRTADVRARVAGVLQKRVYTEGTQVEKGQLLFQIDPAPLKAALNAQLANLAAAKATYTNNHVAAERARSIADKGLMSKTDLDNAQAAERTAAAAVRQAEANVETAKINLGYADVRAPISGRAGQQQVTEGALVGQSDATLLTTISQVDPIYVNFSEAVGELEQMRREQAAGDVTLTGQNKASVELMLPDGTPYGQVGTLDFSDVTVDPSTGSVSLRGIVPNPDHSLLPGMYVNVRVTFGELKQVFLIPQAAVLRDAQGPYVFVVKDGKAQQKRITAPRQRDGDWVVTGGIAAGDDVVVSGVQKVKPDAPAKAVPWKPEANPAAAAPNGAPPPQGGKPAEGKPADGKPAANAGGGR